MSRRGDWAQAELKAIEAVERLGNLIAKIVMLDSPQARQAAVACLAPVVSALASAAMAPGLVHHSFATAVAYAAARVDRLENSPSFAATCGGGDCGRGAGSSKAQAEPFLEESQTPPASQVPGLSRAEIDSLLLALVPLTNVALFRKLLDLRSAT